MAGMWASYSSNMYRYGLLFMCAAAALSLFAGGGGAKNEWQFMRDQYDIRQQQKTIESKEKNNGNGRIQ